MLEKKIARKHLKEIRASLSQQYIDEQSQLLTIAIQQEKWYQEAQVIALFYSMDKEFNTKFFMDDQSKIFVFPKIINDELVFCGDDGEYEINQYGIIEPKNLKIVDKIDLMIVPYLGYSNSGYRIGYGKGYYDRYLKHRSIKTILPGIKNYCLDFKIDKHDIKIKKVIIK